MNIFKSKILYIFYTLFGVVVIAAVFFYFTNDGVATEFRQIRQPKPNMFYVGIDVSGSIDETTLGYLRENLISRLHNFVGEPAVSYRVNSFGNPGCADQSIRDVVPKQPSPEDETAFTYKVEKKIDNIRVSPKSITPLHYLLQKMLGEWEGGRLIIFSDLINEDGDCPRQYPFPENTLVRFGESKTGQIIFLYPKPYTTDTPNTWELRNEKKQQEFIEQMRSLVNEGKVRAFFYQIPDDPEKRSAFIRRQFKNAIPTTTFEIIWERATRVVDTMVSAVRG